MTTRTAAGAAIAAALLVLPALASAQEDGPLPRRRPAVARPAPAAASDDGALRVGGLLGFEFGEGDTGLALRLDGEMKIQDLAPRVGLSGVASVGFTHFVDDVRDLRVTTNLVKLVPAARVTFRDVAPQLGLYGDVGLGLYYASQTLRFRGTAFADQTDSTVSFTMRFAGGAFYDASDRLRLGAELGVNPYFGDFDHTTVTLFALATWRL